MEVLLVVREQSFEGVDSDFVLFDEGINQHNPLYSMVNAVSHEIKVQNEPLTQHFSYNCFI